MDLKDLPNICRIHASKTGRLHNRVGMVEADVELGGLVVAVRLDDAHVLLVLGSHLLVLLTSTK